MISYTWHNDLLLYNSFIYISKILHLDVLWIHHDNHLINHFDIIRTLELLSHNYWFPQISSYIKQYISIYNLYSHSKSSWYMKHDEFLSLSILSDLWKEISCDYIIDLSLSNDFDILLIFIDWFIKMIYLIPYNKIIDVS